MKPNEVFPEVLGKLPGAVLQNVGAILEKAWPLLLLLAVLGLLGRLLRSPRVKGRFGEVLVSKATLRRLDPGRYKVFDDLVLPRPDGRGTTQIDHVVASPFGIFVIETKNFAGWIFGDENARHWTQVIYGKKCRFQNPLHQNALHVRALAAATELPPSCFQNLVFFAGEATLKTSLPPQVMTRGLLAYIRGHRDELLSPEELNRACETLARAREVAPALRKEHRSRMARAGGV